MVACSAQALYEWRQSALGAAAATRPLTGAESLGEAVDEAVEMAEVDWLLREMGGLDGLRLRLLRPQDSPVELACGLAQIDRVWQARLRDRSPIQYGVGHMTWREFRLRVSPAVLIPRPETELMIEIAGAKLAGRADCLADVGTGSGAIALGLAAGFKSARVYGLDRSEAALGIARENCLAYGAAGQPGERVTLLEGNWLEPLAEVIAPGELDGLFSNPPYIPSAIVETLQPEVRDHEPRLALDGGETGLDAFRPLAIGGKLLRSGGLWIVEHMVGQSGAIVDLLNATGGYENIEVHLDWNRCDRFVSAIRR
jgi:release factor glutamine methyltransferase